MQNTLMTHDHFINKIMYDHVCSCHVWGGLLCVLPEARAGGDSRKYAQTGRGPYQRN